MEQLSSMRLELDHFILEVTDPERSIAFYRDVLGMAPERAEEFAAGKAPFPSLRVNEATVIDLFPRRLWRGERPENPNHLCLTTSHDGMAELKRRLAGRGITITRTNDHNFGARGYGRSIYFDDPDGVSVEVRYYPEVPSSP